MTMFKLVLSCTLLGPIAFGSSSQAAGGRQPVVDGSQSTIALLRAINTTQAELLTRGGFGSLGEVLPQTGQTPSEALTPDVDEEIVGDVTLRLLRSADRRRYQVTARTSGDCKPAWFTDERGVIYAGYALGCGALMNKESVR